jgi:hypothetical protein
VLRVLNGWLVGGGMFAFLYEAIDMSQILRPMDDMVYRIGNVRFADCCER